MRSGGKVRTAENLQTTRPDVEFDSAGLPICAPNLEIHLDAGSCDILPLFELVRPPGRLEHYAATLGAGLTVQVDIVTGIRSDAISQREQEQFHID